MIGVGVLGISGCATAHLPGHFDSVDSKGQKFCTPISPELKGSHLPKVLGLAPAVSFEQGGGQIKVSGRGFKPGVQILLGEFPCGSLNYINEASLTCVASNHFRGKVDVSVVNPDSSCDRIPGGFEYFPTFQILPKKGRVNTGDQFQLKVQGGTLPLRFSVLEGAGNVDPKTGLYSAPQAPGKVLIRVVDAQGMTDVSEFEVQGGSRLPASESLILAASSSQIGVGGTLSLSATGGVGPYQFSIDPSLGAIDQATGRLTALKGSSDVKVKVRDLLGHEAFTSLKFSDRIQLTGADRLEFNQVGVIQAEGGVPPYTFSIASGPGRIDAGGNFTSPELPASTVILAKDSLGSSGQISILTVPPLSLSPTETEAVPGGSMRFTAAGGYMPYSFRLVRGLGFVDPVSGVYTAPETATSDTIEVKDSRGVVATAKVEIHSLMVPRRISASLAHTCAVMKGAAKCWGENRWGQLGDGTLRRKLQPVIASGLGSHVASVTTGYRHSCALLGSGEVKCWGDNSKGQLGYQSLAGADIQQSSIPHTVAGLGQGVVAIAAGEFHTCAIRDSKIFCWGDNSKGQLGSALHGVSPVPVQVAEISEGVQSITAGSFHSCAIVNGGALCWGANFNGQLGNHSQLDSDVPVKVFGMNQGVKRIEAKGNHTCAQAQDDLFCWGYNASGQLGNRATKSASVPMPVIGVEGLIEELSLGTQYTCVRTAAAPKVRCWGYNFFGQLGQVGGGIQQEPQVVNLPDSVSALGAGVEHTCALLASSYLCWGHNSSGQLGNRTTKDFWLPEPKEKLD